MRVMITDPITLKDVTDVENAPYVEEGRGTEQLRIYFNTEQNKLEYEAIADELGSAGSVIELLDTIYDSASFTKAPTDTLVQQMSICARGGRAGPNARMRPEPPPIFGQEIWPPTREAAQSRWLAFLPDLRVYARGRNYADCDKEHVSRLSPYIRHRLLLETEVIEQTLQAHPIETVEKFIQEVCWRTYWKGWLQLRPQVWLDYREDLHKEHQRMSAACSYRYHTAINGETHLTCFNNWVKTLKETGYLHNHVRMWFASVWIFSLRLPWTLGAELFYQHLLDGDPASNTLSWRWVAGLHTRGKHYLAKAANIDRYTEGAYQPYGQLNESAAPLQDLRVYEYKRLAPQPEMDPGKLTGLLITPDDARPEDSDLRNYRIVTVAAGWDSGIQRSYGISGKVSDFSHGALQDALGRAAQQFAVPTVALDEANWVKAVCDWADREQLEQVVTLEAPVGPWADNLCKVRRSLAQSGIALIQHRRRWDALLWPQAQRGFFAFRQHIPKALTSLSSA